MRQPRISVVMSCFNYEAYVAAAIESALAQEPPPHEVIVVDDGSTDGSVARVRPFGDRVHLIEQPNAGQAVAISTGVEVATGDVIVLLDADDLLEPGILRLVGAAFVADPTVVKVHWRLRIIDRRGEPTGAVQPPRPGLLADGDLRRVVLTTRNHAWPPTSANAWRADVLRRVLPIPDDYSRGPDKYLAETVPLFGRIRALDEIGTGYRVHGENKHTGGSTTAQWARRQIELGGVSTETVRRLAPEAGFDPSECPDADDVLDPALITARLVSLRLDPEHHPIPGDRSAAVAAKGLRSLAVHPALGWRSRAKRGAWFVAVGCTPAPVARRVIDTWTPDAPDHLAR